IEILENENGLCLSQRKYCLELLSEFGLLACKPAATPLQQNVVLNHKESENDKFLPNMTGRHMHAPLQSHFTAALRVLRYLKYAPGNGVQFHKGKSFGLHAYWAKCPKTRKSVFGFCLYLCNNLVSWKNLEVDGLLPTHLYCDSSSAISIARNLVFHKKTKHFEIDLHLVREKVTSGVVKVLKVASASNVADIFIKGLSIT
ncbi:ribonuclease H-like domain-containing protein, partial [Tanacetum coccineum]